MENDTYFCFERGGKEKNFEKDKHKIIADLEYATKSAIILCYEFTLSNYRLEMCYCR